MSPGPEPEALYQEADRLLKKWRYHWDKDVLEDARQELVLAGLLGKDMRSRLYNFMKSQKYYRDFAELRSFSEPQDD